MTDKIIKFAKYHGLGNDFIVVDATSMTKPISTEVIKQLCQRRFGAGADGYLELHHSSRPGCEFRMDYYSSYGKLGGLCGNGSRCALAYAKKCGLFAGSSVIFEACGRSHSARINPINPMVTIQMADVTFIKQYDTDNFFVDTGSPHHIRYVTNLSDYPVISEGRELTKRFYSKQPASINFLHVFENGNVYIRTYESTVKEETILACGTGSTAAAITTHFKTVQFDNSIGKAEEKTSQSTSVVVKAEGGDAVVSFNRMGECRFSNVTLTGPTCHVYDGTWHC